MRWRLQKRVLGLSLISVEMKKMRDSRITAAMGLIIFLLASGALSLPTKEALEDRAAGIANRTGDPAIEMAKNSLLSSLEKKAMNLERFKAKIENSGLEQQKKEEFISEIDRIVAGMQNFSEGVPNASSAEGVESLKKAVNQYISENKEQIAEILKQYQQSLTNESLETLYQVVDLIEEKLDTLAEICPDYSEEISSLQQNLELLVQELIKLSEMVEQQESQAKINMQMAKLLQITEEMAKDIESIAIGCSKSNK